MKRQTFVVFVTLIFSSILSFSQTKKNDDGKPAKQSDANGGLKTKARTSEPKQQQGIKTESVFQLDENDAYQGRKEEFLAQITLKELPSDFPKYEKWMGVRHYNQIIDEYYKKHLDILIPSLRQKLEGR